MPRNGAGVYSHPFPNVVEGTTIESAVFNGNTSDVEQDLNTPRPIVAGGTGANNAHDALINLHGEESGQLVDNYDSFPFVAGSFYSLAKATAAPDDINAFAGICYRFDNNSMTLEARIQGTTAPGNTLYVRQKTGGVWGGWTLQAGAVSDLDGRYVNVAGDTMSGELSSTSIKTGNSGAKGGWYFFGTDNTCNLNLDAGGNNYRLNGGTSFGINGQNMYVNVNSGAATTPGTYQFNGSGAVYLAFDGSNYTLAGGSTFTVNGGIMSAQAGGTGTYYFTGTGTKYLNYDGAGFNLVGGTFQVSGTVRAGGEIWVGYGLAAGVMRFSGTVGDKYIHFDGTTFNMSAGLVVSGAISVGANTVTAGAHYVTGTQGMLDGGSGNTLFRTGAGYFFQNGAGNANWAVLSATGMLVPSGVFAGTAGIGGGGNLYLDGNFNVRGNATTLTTFRTSDGAMIQNFAAYKPGGGAWADSSDSRIKNVEGEYTRGLADVIALRPVYFTYKGNDTHDAPAHNKTGDAEADAKMAETPLTVPYPNSSHSAAAKSATKYAGLIAQEVELVFPEMVTKTSAYIDGQPVTDLRNLDTSPLIFALINAVKELKAEVDALKAAR